MSGLSMFLVLNKDMIKYGKTLTLGKYGNIMLIVSENSHISIKQQPDREKWWKRGKIHDEFRLLFKFNSR